MRSIVVALTVALLLAASSASGQGRRSPAKRVKVTNLPDVQAVEVVNAPAVQSVEVTNQPEVQAVEIVNPVAPTPAPPMRFQLVGFTSAAYAADMGGPFSVTQKCQLEFAKSRMCTAEEVRVTTSIPEGLIGQAWVEPDGHEYMSSCRRWFTTYANERGETVDADGFATGPAGEGTGGMPQNRVDCATGVQPIACCALVP